MSPFKGKRKRLSISLSVTRPCVLVVSIPVRGRNWKRFTTQLTEKGHTLYSWLRTVSLHFYGSRVQLTIETLKMWFVSRMKIRRRLLQKITVSFGFLLALGLMSLVTRTNSVVGLTSWLQCLVETLLILRQTGPTTHILIPTLSSVQIPEVPRVRSPVPDRTLGLHFQRTGKDNDRNESTRLLSVVYFIFTGNLYFEQVWVSINLLMLILLWLYAKERTVRPFLII